MSASFCVLVPFRVSALFGLSARCGALTSFDVPDRDDLSGRYDDLVRCESLLPAGCSCF